MKPEPKATFSIDALLVVAGRQGSNLSDATIHAASSLAIREFFPNAGKGVQLQLKVTKI